jgi:isopentenyldiphosphate isomerase
VLKEEKSYAFVVFMAKNAGNLCIARVCLGKQTWLLMCDISVVGHTSIDANLG